MTESQVRQRRMRLDTAHPAAARSVDGRSRSTGIDGAATARGASRGFSVLVMGGVVQPLVSKLTHVDAGLLLGALTVGAFVAAALGVGPIRHSGAHGAIAASASYLLAVPLLMLIDAHPPVVVLLLVGCLAVVVGGGAGSVAAWLRTRAGARRESV